MNPHEIIQAEKADFPVALMCRALAVSRSGFYAARSRPVAKRERENAELTGTIRRIHEESRKAYGSPRIHAELRADLGTWVATVSHG